MKKLLGIVVLGLLCGNVYAADYFKYKSIIGCGPKEVHNLEELPAYETWKYYFIHIAQTGQIVIYNDDFQYTNFEKRRYSQLWSQNHKITSLTLKKDEVTNIYHFEMISEYDQSHPEEHEKLVNFFNLNIESMTFAYRRVGYPSKKKYEATTGICWVVVK